MTFQAKLKADYWVGGFLLALLFMPVRGLRPLLRRDHTTQRRRGCVVIKLVGAGSLFLAMPSMLEIRRTFPAGGFYLVGTPAVVKVVTADRSWIITPAALAASARPRV